jgi:DNA polymerase III alpha subunit
MAPSIRDTHFRDNDETKPYSKHRVTEKIVSTKKGEPMEFVTFEDQTSLYDATFFPKTYRRYCHLLASDQAYLVTGVVEEHFATVTVTVTQLRPLSAPDAEDTISLSVIAPVFFEPGIAPGGDHDAVYPP